MQNPKFTEHLERMAAVHDAKSDDYATTADPLSNFKFAATAAGTDTDTVFRVLIGVKLARLNELLKGKRPSMSPSMTACSTCPSIPRCGLVRADEPAGDCGAWLADRGAHGHERGSGSRATLAARLRGWLRDLVLLVEQCPSGGESFAVGA